MKQWDLNMLVAYNVAKARQLRGWTQETAVAKVNAVQGDGAWTKATWSAAERSIDGRRIRQFTPNNLMDFSRAFDLPLMFWVTPPGSDDTEVWFYLFPGYEKPSRGLYGQAAVSYYLKDFKGELTKRLQRTGLSDVARGLAGGEPSLERIHQLVDQANTLVDVADLLYATVGAVAEATLDRSIGDEVAAIVDRLISRKVTQSPEAASTEWDAAPSAAGTIETGDTGCAGAHCLANGGQDGASAPFDEKHAGTSSAPN